MSRNLTLETKVVLLSLPDKSHSMVTFITNSSDLGFPQVFTAYWKKPFTFQSKRSHGLFPWLSP